MLLTRSSKMEKPNRPGKIGFFINGFFPVCLTMPQHKEFILNVDGPWLKLFLYLNWNARCAVLCDYQFYVCPGLWTPNLDRVLSFIPHCCSPYNVFCVFFLISYPWHGIWDGGCQRQECEALWQKMFLGSKEWYFLWIPSGATWMPAGRTLDGEEKETWKKKGERAPRGSDGVAECGRRGMKTEREDASSLNMYSWETGS